ncbi:hypothetical protein [Paenibacillus terrigena]|uniref:hypothetical protein n=1 Tax=Paenibacillus terrigena TaxID=369333 RepID=UPI00037A1ED2|nr:hypothetical protein [Paenibacillus terrigena]
MAKLNGVKTVSAAETIEYSGAQYGASEAKAAVGDIIRFEDRSSYVTRDAFYEIVRIDSCDDPQIIDEDGDEFDLAGEEYTTFKRKTDALPVTEYIEVKRMANKGERIKITNPVAAIGYGLGSVLTVTHETGHCGLKDDVAVRVAEVEQGIFHREYVVLEPANIDVLISQKQLELAELERKKAESERLKVGEYAKVVNPKPMRQSRLGKIVEIIKDTHDRQPFRGKLLGTDEGNWYYESELVRATDEEVAAAKVALDPRSKFAVGDKVRLISGGETSGLRDYNDGGVYTVSNPKYHTGKIEITGGGQPTAYALVEQLEKLTADEIQALEFSVGDHVKLTIANGTYPKHGWGDASNGDVGVIRKIEGSKIYVNFPKHAHWTAEASELTKISVEEAAEIEKWAKIGRKVGEFRDGDAVRFTESTGATNYGTGSIAVIREVNGCDFTFGVGHNFSGDTAWCELIAPVEAFFTKAAA